jgi:hypothetical protein
MKPYVASMPILRRGKDNRVGCDRIVKKRSTVYLGHLVKWWCGNPGRVEMPNGEILCRMHSK